MSKLVNWGHWVVAASIAFYIGLGIYDGILHLTRAAHTGHNLEYLVEIAARDLLLIAVFVAVGWGILIWADWAHGLLTLVMALGVVVVAYDLFTGGREALNWDVVGGLTMYSLTLLWLLLPAVRHRYWQIKKRDARRLISWGRWLSVIFFGAAGLYLFWGAITSLPKILREHPQEITYYFVSDALFWVPTLVCAWGIYKWRRWSRSLGIALSAVDFVGLGLICWSVYHSGMELHAFWPLATLISGFILVWLMLPRVRLEYSRRDQIA
jgi:hypothetical protein